MATGSVPSGWTVAHQQDLLTECIGLIRETLPFYYDDMGLVHCVRNINAGCMNVWQRVGGPKQMAIAFHLRRDPVGASGTPVLHYTSFGIEAGYDPKTACDDFVTAIAAFKQSTGLKVCFIRQPELDITLSRLGPLLQEAESRAGLLGMEVSRPEVPPWPASFEREINP